MQVQISKSSMLVKDFFEISGKKPEISDYTDYGVTITQIRDGDVGLKAIENSSCYLLVFHERAETSA
jgi:hypothetical protein